MIVVIVTIATLITGIAAGLAGVPLLESALAGLALGGTVGVIYYNLSGNRKVVRAAPEVLERARKMQPKRAKAGLYLLRKGYIGSRLGMDVAIEGVASGQLRSGLFLHAEVEPGTYDVTARPARNANETTHESVTLQAGETVVVLIALSRGGIFNKAKMVQVRNRDDARAMIGSAEMIVPETSVDKS